MRLTSRYLAYSPFVIGRPWASKAGTVTTRRGFSLSQPKDWSGTLLWSTSCNPIVNVCSGIENHLLGFAFLRASSAIPSKSGVLTPGGGRVLLLCSNM